MEHTTFEQAVEVVNSLPTSERERFSEWFKVQEELDTQANTTCENKADDQTSSAQTVQNECLEDRLALYKKTEKWLRENREKYMGQWVALEGDRLIAHGPDALKVHAEAKAAGIAVPFVEHIVEEKEPFYAGW